MKHRFVCIYKKNPNGQYDLKIEVCNEIGTASLPPFLRRLDIDLLYDDDIQENIDILNLINQSGSTQQSKFEINNNEFLCSEECVDVLKKQKWIYSESTKNGSVKKSTCPLVDKKHNEHVGRLLNGELYIDDLSNWNRGIRVKFRYDEAMNSFLPFYNKLPFVKIDDTIAYRDPQKETMLLSSLGTCYCANSGKLNLNGYDTNKLSEIVKSGWKLFVPTKSKSYSSVYLHNSPSGITWFSTEMQPESSISKQLLESFMKSRNYEESDGNIRIFDSKSAIMEDDIDFVGQLVGSKDVLALYEQRKFITVSSVEEKVKQYVNATLRNYQINGVVWLQQQRANGCGCLLADDMGLGKTLQVIAHLACLPQDLKHIIIAPVSLIYNWQNEINSFAPQIMKQVTLVSYDMLRLHVDEYTNDEYDTLVVDEAQIIKNRDTKKYKAISSLQCHHRISLTGTPIENSIEDMWSHFIMLNPCMKLLYHNLQSHRADNNDESYVAITSKLLKPFILRRTKTEVLCELPEKTERTVYIELSHEERIVYDNIHKTILYALSTGVSGRVNSIALEALLRLRQTCVSVNILPAELSKIGHVNSTKLMTALEFIMQFKQDGSKVLVFSQFVAVLHEFEQILQEHDISFVSLYGDSRDRKTIVNRFQEDATITVFLISLKAGGVGLNLTAADRVMLLDDWWNPAVEDQAMGRSHRIGQHNPVFVYRLICRDTVEEKILKLQERKRYTVDVFEQTSGRLTMEEIKDMI
ncbi:MAG: DEAD/DEAH box helicase [Bacteroidales bacterium]|nr:DEAD/DEAH box helicase [Bacteroidales bacterium]